MYEAFFRLSGKPFQLNPDPSFYFASKGHRRARAYLEYGLHQGEGFIVITGEVGAGKTTLLRGVLERLPTDSIVATQIVSTQVDADDMLRLVCEGFGIPTVGADKSTLLTHLRQYCLHEYEQGRKALLIVDEAQNLPPTAVEELRMLSNFQIGNRSLVQSFLVGQPELRRMLQDPEMRQLKQRIIASYHLGPMDADDTRSYVEHRLRHVGWANDPSFDDSAFENIYTQTDGIPRRINGLCDRVLLACYLSSLHEISGTLVQEVSGELALELEPQALPPVSSPVRRTDQAPSDLSDSSSRHSRREEGPAVAEGPPTTDRLDELDHRVALLEMSQDLLRAQVKRLKRQLERQALV